MADDALNHQEDGADILIRPDANNRPSKRKKRKKYRLSWTMILGGLVVGWVVPTVIADTTQQKNLLWASTHSAASESMPAPVHTQRPAPVTITDLERSSVGGYLIIKGRLHNHSGQDIICNDAPFVVIGEETTQSEASESSCSSESVADGTGTNFVMTFLVSGSKAKTLRFDTMLPISHWYINTPISSIPVVRFIPIQ